MGTQKIDLTTITSEDAERKASALRTFLDMMDVPETRKEITRANVAWLSRNLAIQNSDHPMFACASDLVKWLARWHRKQC